MKKVVCRTCGTEIKPGTQRYEWGLKEPVMCEKCILKVMEKAFLGK